MYFEDFIIGNTYRIPPVVIAREKITAFALEYDPLPIHTDEAYAQQTSYKGLIAPGVMSFMSVWAEFVKMNLWEDNLLAGMSTKIQWFKPVYAGDTLRGCALVTAVHDRNERCGVVEITIEIENQAGVRVICDTTEIVMKKRTAVG